MQSKLKAQSPKPPEQGGHLKRQGWAPRLSTQRRDCAPQGKQVGAATARLTQRLKQKWHRSKLAAPRYVNEGYQPHHHLPPTSAHNARTRTCLANSIIIEGESESYLVGVKRRQAVPLGVHEPYARLGRPARTRDHHHPLQMRPKRNTGS